MSSHFDTLRERRLAMVERSDADRAALAASFDDLAHELRFADTVVATAQRLKGHPVVVGIAAAGLVLAPALVRKWIRKAGWLLPVVVGVLKLVRNKKD